MSSLLLFRFLLLLSLVHFASCKASNVGFQLYMNGAGLTIADQVVVIKTQTSLSSNQTKGTSSICAEAQLDPTMILVPATNVYTASDDGTQASVYMSVNGYSGNAKLCFIFYGSTSAWTDSSIELTILPAQIFSSSLTATGATTFSVVANQKFEVSLEGQGLAIGSGLVTVGWRQDCLLGPNVKGGEFKTLVNVNNEGTKGTVEFTITEAATAVSLCYNIEGKTSYQSAHSTASSLGISATSWQAFDATGTSVSTVLPLVTVRIEISGSGLFGMESQRSCSLAPDLYYTCVMIDTSCNNLGQVPGGASVVPVSVSANTVRAEFVFSDASTYLGSSRDVSVCVKMAQATSWNTVGTAKLTINYPLSTVSSVTPTISNSNNALSVTLTGTNLYDQVGLASKIKLSLDCESYPVGDSTGVIVGGSAQSCSSVITNSSGLQSCVVTFDSLFVAGTTSAQVMICLAQGPSTTYSRTLSVISVTPSFVSAVQAPSTSTANIEFSIYIVGQNLASSGAGAIMAWINRNCSTSDSTDVFGGEARYPVMIGSNQMLAQMKFTITTSTARALMVCWNLSSASSSAFKVTSAFISASPPTLTGISLTNFSSLNNSQVTVFGSDFVDSGPAAPTFVIMGNCSDSRSFLPVQKNFVLSGSQLSFLVITNVVLTQLEMCWRIGTSPYQTLMSNISIYPTSVSSFQPLSGRAFSSISLTVSGQNLGQAMKVKLSTDCTLGTSSDSIGTLSGSEGVAPTSVSSEAAVFSFSIASIVSVKLQVCWQMGDGLYQRLGGDWFSLLTGSVSASFSSQLVSNVPFSITLTGYSFKASPSSALVKLKLSQDCSLQVNLDNNTCGGGGDCVQGGQGVLGTMVNSIDLRFDFVMAVRNQVTMKLCWTLNSSPLAYIDLDSRISVLVNPVLLTSSVIPANVFVNEPFLVQLLGTGLSSSSAVPTKVKLSTSCMGADDVDPLLDIAGGEARYISCTDASTGSAYLTFTVRDSSSPFVVCAAQGALGSPSSPWQEVKAANTPYRVRSATVTSASLSPKYSSIMNNDLVLLFSGRGLGSSFEDVKVKLVNTSQGCSSSYSDPGQFPCSCSSSLAAELVCNCASSSSDSGYLAGGAPSLVLADSSSSGHSSFIPQFSGAATACWSYGGIGLVGTSYLELLRFTVSQPSIACFYPLYVAPSTTANFYLLGQGMRPTDTVKIVREFDGCSSPALLSGTLGSGVSMSGMQGVLPLLVSMELGTYNRYILCYSFGLNFTRVGFSVLQVSTPVIESFSPAALIRGDNVVTIYGRALHEGLTFVLTLLDRTCAQVTAASALVNMGPISCDDKRLSCSLSFTVPDTVSTILYLCQRPPNNQFLAVGSLKLQGPSASTITPSAVSPDVPSSFEVSGSGFFATGAVSASFLARGASCSSYSSDQLVASVASTSILFVNSTLYRFSYVFAGGSIGDIRVCFRTSTVQDLGTISIVSPSISLALPRYLTNLTLLTVIQQGVPFNLSLQGTGLSSPNIFVKIVPSSQLCQGTVSLVTGAAAGGEARLVSSQQAQFPAGIRQSGPMHVCFLTRGAPSFLDVPSSSFTVLPPVTVTSIIPAYTIAGDGATKVFLYGSALVSSSFSSSLFLSSADCIVGSQPPGGSSQLLVDDDGGNGRVAFASFVLTSPGTFRLCVQTSLSSLPQDVGAINVLAASSLPLLAQIAPTSLLAGQATSFVLRGQALSSTLKLMVASSCSSPTSYISSIASVNDNRTIAYSSALTVPFISSSVKICIATSSSSTYLELVTLSMKSLIRPSLYQQPAAPLLLYRNFPADLEFVGDGIGAGDAVFISSSSCPSDPAKPVLNLLSVVPTVPGGEVKVIASSMLVLPLAACETSRYRLSFRLTAMSSSSSPYSICYVPLGFAYALTISPGVQVVTPFLSSFLPKFVNSMSFQQITFQGSGGYAPGDKLILLSPYSSSSSFLTRTCQSYVGAYEQVATSLRYTVRALDINGRTLVAYFNLSETRTEFLACYQPYDATGWRDVTSVSSGEVIKVVPPTASSLATPFLYARSLTTLSVVGLGLSFGDSYKIVKEGGSCQSDLPVVGGDVRIPSRISQLADTAQVSFLLGAEAIGRTTVCFLPRGGCDFSPVASLEVRPPAPLAVDGSTDYGGAILNHPFLLRLSGIGLSSTDDLTVVPGDVACSDGVMSSARIFSYASSSSASADGSLSSFLLTVTGYETRGKLCFRYCSNGGCSGRSSFRETGLYLKLLEPTVTQVKPNEIQKDMYVTFDIQGNSFTPKDNFKLVHSTAPCSGSDSALDVMTGGNGRAPWNVSCPYALGVQCKGAVSFTIEGTGTGKLCYLPSGGAGYRDILLGYNNTPYIIQVCEGEHEGMSGARRRWSGKQLAVGILGRHRACIIELTSSGVLRVLAVQSMNPQSPKEKFVVDEAACRTTVEAECWVEDLTKEVEAKARNSRPEFNALHLLFPRRDRTMPETKYDSYECLVFEEKAGTALLVRVQILGDKGEEEECQEEINRARKVWAERRFEAQNKVVAILDLRFASFNPQEEM
ncbi:hypothetical protein GUITHDRAFT_135895 [Guillardia theta CCMP2712]|uniref:Uncharacterized protein n=1 Tax=Guillardia theta (strain CCMP2712) TaxID=905079 RepID=L1JNT3_GUITC|nr:hypothetical protein GUITHDRAFT_135895 [Guillardia theta CCMP2712]EKX49733.1 hypothetical protein GUITHDRAFT_135895 [Guillardia theta CCMP2712]|eukprot:XP_005836713.1 hypothetical protein GUITHDRAFT_135895 [Guillardia theta CCMP2712]